MKDEELRLRFYSIECIVIMCLMYIGFWGAEKEYLRLVFFIGLGLSIVLYYYINYKTTQLLK